MARSRTLRFFILLFFICFSTEALAQLRDHVFKPGTELGGKPFPEYNQSDEPKEVWPYPLPFLAQKVIDRGFSLPHPFGLSLIFFHQNQGLSIDSLDVAFADNAPLRSVDFIDFEGTTVDNTDWQLKFDTWILPFLNAFLTAGTVKGQGSVPISLASKDIYDFFIPGLCDGGSPPAFCDGQVSAVAPIDYHGYNVGIGILLGTAYKNFFFAVPITYALTSVNVSDDNIEAYSVIPRIGYNLLTPHSGKFGFYVGANYLNTTVNLTGKYTLPMAGTPIGHDVTVRYKLEQHPLTKWNAIAGVNWELSALWSMVLELGFSKERNNQTFIFTYRF